MGSITSFQKDLRNGFTIDEALNKHGLSLKEVFNYLHKETLKKTRPVTSNEGSVRKNPQSDHYHVKKTIKGTNVVFGTYATKEEAEIIRQELIKHSWDKNKLDEILKKTGIKRIRQNHREVSGDMNCYKNTMKHFTISKEINNEVICGGTYSSLEDAKKVRDELKSMDWDVSKVDEICKKHNIHIVF